MQLTTATITGDDLLYFRPRKNSREFRTNKKNAQFFKNITPGNKGLLTNFFSKREILYLFRDFKIIELREDIHLVHFPQKKIFSTWNIICKNK